MKPKFTPGPWKAVHRAIGCSEYADEYCGLGLEIEGPPEATNRGQFAKAADARLIAASPEMFALLDRLGSIIGNKNCEGSEWECAEEVALEWLSLRAKINGGAA